MKQSLTLSFSDCKWVSEAALHNIELFFDSFLTLFRQKVNIKLEIVTTFQYLLNLHF